MTAVIALVAVSLFAVCFRLLKVTDAAGGALARSRATMGVLMNDTSSELEKEAAARAAGVALLASFFRISAGICAAAAPAVALICAAIAAGLTTMSSLTAALSSPWMIAAACLVSAAAFLPRA